MAAENNRPKLIPRLRGGTPKPKSEIKVLTGLAATRMKINLSDLIKIYSSITSIGESVVVKIVDCSFGIPNLPEIDINSRVVSECLSPLLSLIAGDNYQISLIKPSMENTLKQVFSVRSQFNKTLRCWAQAGIILNKLHSNLLVSHNNINWNTIAISHDKGYLIDLESTTYLVGQSLTLDNHLNTKIIFASPEQLTNAREGLIYLASFASDVFSFGITLIVGLIGIDKYYRILDIKE